MRWCSLRQGVYVLKRRIKRGEALLPCCPEEKGFTLVEILVALAISSIVISGVYAVYINQLKGAKAQERIVAMRQNWRAGHYVIGRELMRAGYSVHIKDAVTPGFTQAEKGALAFSYVADGTDDLVSVAFAINKDHQIVRTVTRAGTGIASPVAEEIEHLEFIYQLKNGTTTWAPTAGELDDIRGVRVTILARTSVSVGDYPHEKIFALPFPNGETENLYQFASDGIYRQMVTGFFNCRNMAGR